MADLHHIHTSCVPNGTSKAIRHQAVELELSLSKWVAIILAYVGARDTLASEIYETYMWNDGHADTIPEMAAVHA